MPSRSPASDPDCCLVAEVGGRLVAEAAYRWWPARGEPPLDAGEFTVTATERTVLLTGS